MRRASRSRGDWVWKRTSPLPKDWHIPGESWSDLLVVMVMKRSKARFINQKVAQWYNRRAQILFMKVKWDRQNAARKAWGSTWSMGPQPVSNEALAESWSETRQWTLNPAAVKCSTKKSSNRGDSGPSIRISLFQKLRPKQKWFKSTPSEGIFLPSVLKWDERNGGRSRGLPEDAWGDLIR